MGEDPLARDAAARNPGRRRLSHANYSGLPTLSAIYDVPILVIGLHNYTHPDIFVKPKFRGRR
jgi:hypothetical protein